MNEVEIEQALSEPATQPLGPVEFLFALLPALGNKANTLQRLRKGGFSVSDMPGGILERLERPFDLYTQMTDELARNALVESGARRRP